VIRCAQFMELRIKERDWKDRKRTVLLHFGTMSDMERVDMFEELRGLFCQGCGRMQPEGEQPCQCDNDD